MPLVDSLQFRVGVDGSDFKRGLSSLTTEAKRAGNQMGQALSGSGAAQGLGKIEKATTKASGAMRAFAVQIPDVASSLAAGQNPMTVFAQQGLQVGQQLAVMGSLTPGVVAGFGALGAAVAPLAGAYIHFSAEAERATAEMEFNKEVADSLEPTYRRLEDALVDLAVAEGTLSEVQGQVRSIRLDAQRSVLDYGEEIADQRAEIEEDIKANERWIEVTSLIPNLGGKIADSMFGWSDSIEQGRGQLQQLNEAEVEHADLQKQIADALERSAELREAERTSTRAQSDAQREQARELRELEAGLRSVAAIRDRASLAGLEGEERIIEKYRQQLEDLQAIQDRIGFTQELEEARYEVILAKEREIAAFREKVAEEQKKGDEDGEEVPGEILGAYEKLFAATSDGFDFMSEKIGEKSKALGMILYGLAKTAALGEIAFNVAKGLVVAQTVLPPLNAIHTATVIAAGATATAKVMSAPAPSFDVGGIIQGRSPDQVMVASLPGEARLNREATEALGEDGVNRLNRLEGRGGSMLLIDAFRHFHYRFDDDARRPGPIRDAVRQGAMAGQR